MWKIYRYHTGIWWKFDYILSGIGMWYVKVVFQFEYSRLARTQDDMSAPARNSVAPLSALGARRTLATRPRPAESALSGARCALHPL